MVVKNGRIRKKITLNKSKFPLLSLHVLVTLPKERPSGSGIMIDLAGQQIFTNKKIVGNGWVPTHVRSILSEGAWQAWRMGSQDLETWWMVPWWSYVLSPKDRGQRGNPSKWSNPNYLQVRPGVSSSGSVELETGGKLSPKNLSSRVRSSCKLFFSEWENLPPSQDVAFTKNHGKTC